MRVALSGTREALKIGCPDVAKNQAVTATKTVPQFSVSCGFGGELKNAHHRSGGYTPKNQQFPRRRSPLLSLLPTSLQMRKTWHLEVRA